MTLAIFLASALASIHPFPQDAALQLIAHDAKDLKGTIECIAIDGADPSPSLLAKIKKLLPQAAPASECTKPDQYVVHMPSGKHATVISISGFAQTSATTAAARYSVNSGPLAGNWFTATFRLTNGTWVLVALEGYMAS